MRDGRAGGIILLPPLLLMLLLLCVLLLLTLFSVDEVGRGKDDTLYLEELDDDGVDVSGRCGCKTC